MRMNRVSHPEERSTFRGRKHESVERSHSPTSRFCQQPTASTRRPRHWRACSVVGFMALSTAATVSLPRCCTTTTTTAVLALQTPQRNLNHRSTNTKRRMVLTTPEAIFEQTSTTTLLDDLIDESTRTSARRPIMMQFDPSSGWIWKRWKGTVFSETWDSCVYRMIFASFVYLVCSRHFPQLKQYLSGFNILWAQVLSITTFTLTFFVNQSYALWRKCSELSRRLQGRLHDLDMTLAAHAARKQPANPNEPSTYTAGSRQVLELVSRYVRLFNLLTYASFTRSHRPILTPRGMRRLVERGLMTTPEREVLLQAEIPATQRHNAILLWIIRSFIEGMEAGHFIGEAGFEQQFIEKCHVCRASYGGIGDELQGRMPLAYAHIVQVLVDLVLWMYPFMAYASGMSGILIVLGTGLLTIGYQGLFDLAKQFLDPYDNENYGKGEDPLVVDTLIAETNAGSIRWLHGLSQMPVSKQKFVNSELSDFLLPVRGYSVEELKEMEQEKRELQARREQEELERQRQEAYEERVRLAAEAMIPFEIDTKDSTTAETDAAYVVIFDDSGDKIGLPGEIVPPSFPLVEEVALNVLYSQNVNSTSLQLDLIPDGTAPATAFVVEEIEDLSGETDESGEEPLEEAKEPQRTLFGHFDEDDEDNAFEVIQDWGTQTDYVHRFDAFDPYLDLPSLDKIGPDGQEIRLSQMLADEEWEEEIEYAQEKEKIRTYAEYMERVDALKDAEAKELQETEEILSASADARQRVSRLDEDDLDRSPKYYDQTQLDGISQLFGLPPDELSEIPGYEEPTTTIPDDNFGSVEQLWGDAGLSSTSSERTSMPYPPSLEDETSFDGISELWGEKIEDEAQELLSSSATRRVGSPIDGQGNGIRRKESRLSEMLADEVYGTEEEPPSDRPIMFEDYEKQVQEILEAERAELLETEAIMNAPPGAEDIALPGIDDEDAGDDAYDELAILEMDEELEQEVNMLDASDRSVGNESFQDEVATNTAKFSSESLEAHHSDETALLDEPNGSGDSHSVSNDNGEQNNK